MMIKLFCVKETCSSDGHYP